MHGQQQQKPRFITEIEVESAYGIPKRTLQAWRSRGQGPEFRRFGRNVKYDVQVLESWIQALPSGGASIR